MRKVVSFILVSVLIIGISYWLTEYVEFFEYDQEVGFKGEARKNHFLAGEYFLKAMGQDAELLDVYQGDISKLQAYDSLIMTAHRVSMGIDKSKRLLDWVTGGGHLIITANALSEESVIIHDYIVDTIGIQNYLEYQDDEQFDDVPIDVNINEDIEFLQVSLKRYYNLKITDDFSEEIVWKLESESGVHAIAIKYGAGIVIMLSDMSIFYNNEISKYDNAAFLWGLVNENPAIGKMYYSLRETRESIYQWLYSRAAVFLLLLFLFIIFFLWANMPRFGPIINISPPVRRSFLEHIRANGHYLARRKMFTELVKQSQHYTLNLIYLKFPFLRTENKQDILEVIEKHVNENRNYLNKLLYDPHVNSERNFIKKIKSIENIRKSI